MALPKSNNRNEAGYCDGEGDRQDGTFSPYQEEEEEATPPSHCTLTAKRIWAASWSIQRRKWTLPIGSNHLNIVLPRAPTIGAYGKRSHYDGKKEVVLAQGCDTAPVV